MTQQNSPPAHKATPATFKKGKSSGIGTVLKWLFLTPLILAALAYLWLAILEPYNARRTWQEAGAQLPGCESRYVVKELLDSYGGFYALAAKLLPVNMVFELRRVQSATRHGSNDMHLCHGEYRSLFGNGPIDYSVTWYDTNRRTPDNLKVTVNKLGMPEPISGIVEALK